MIVLWRGNEANRFGPATSGHLGAGLWERMTYPYPPLKRWAIVGWPCGADAADARGLGRQPKSTGRQTHVAKKNRIHTFLRGGNPSPEDDRQ